MTTPKKILFVEDDSDFRETLVEAFRLKGYQTTGVGSIQEFTSEIKDGVFDLAFVDLNLPDGSGFSITRSLRNSTTAKIIILTARDTVGDRVEGYTHGTDIYMIKPASIAELLAATEAMLRPRSSHSMTPPASPWRLDSQNRVLFAPNGTAFNLSARQYTFLNCLMEKPGSLVERHTLWSAISPKKLDSSGKALSMFVARLRKDIEENTNFKLPVETVSGRGFVFQKK